MHHTKKTNLIRLAQWTLLLLHPNFVRPAPQSWVDTLPSFIDPNKWIDRLVVDHNVTGDVFVAGRNVLYRLSADLELKQSVSTGPVQDYPGCPIPPYPCGKPRVKTNNNARLLQLVYYFGDTPSLLLCGTVYNSLCQVRSTDNLEEYHWVHPYDDSLGYVTNGDLNYAHLEPGFDGRWSLFTAAQDDGPHRTRNSAPYLSSRVLEKDGDRYSFQYTFKNDTVSSAVTIKGNKSRYAMDGGFVYGNFIYFPINYFSNSNIVGSRLVRFCTTDPTFQSYAELPIRCSHSDQVFRSVMAAHLGDSHTSSGKALYVSFNNRTGSALCIFEMSAIIEAFTTSARSCNRDIVGEACDQTGEKEIVNFCGSDVSPYVVNQSLEVESFVFVKNVAIIAVTVVKQYDDIVIIAGSNQGILAKISRSTGEVINVKDMLEKNITSPFVSPFVFDRQEEHIYLLVKHKVIKYPVASCGVHETCEECFSRGKGDPLKCGWCAGRCAHLGECAEPAAYSTDTCTPTIYEVFPRKGPIQGGNTVTITGQTFGNYVDDDHNSILVAGIPCAITSWNNTQVNCTLGSTPEVLSGPVQLSVINTFSSALGYNVAGSTFSQSNFSYYVGARLYGIRPSKGPTSGGTVVSLFGQDLDFEKDKKRFVTVCGRPCTVKLLQRNFIHCVTGNISSTKFPSNTTAIHIDGVAYVVDKHPPSTINNLTGLSQTFEYTPDPYIIHIRPGITTLSGLMNLTAIGFHLDSVRFPKLVVHFDRATQIIDQSELLEECWVDPQSNGTTMTCRTPSLKDKLIFPIPTRTHPFMTQVSFVMDGVQQLRDFPRHRDDLSRLLYYPDPEFAVFQETEKIKVDQTVLEIKGTYLDLMHLADNMRVIIGRDESCKITSVSSDVLFCDIPPNLFSNASLSGTNLSVEVITGSTMHHLGYIEFDQQEEESIQLWHIPILWAVAVVVIISCVIFVLYKWWTHIRKKPLYIEVPLANRSFNSYIQVPTRVIDTSGPSSNAVAGASRQGPGAAAAMPPWMAALDEETRFLLAEKDLIIPEERLDRGGRIGSGQFGCVCEGYLKNSDHTKAKVAVKTLHENSWSKPQDVEIFLREALVMKDFQHSNVIKLLGVCFEESGPSIVLEFMVNKDLHSYIIDEKKESIFTAELLKFAVDVSAGMSYLEDAKFVHRDLAARNCLLDHAKDAKVADFGLSRDVYEDGNYVGNTKGKIPYPWTAPEALDSRLYTTKSDVWSFGVLLWELMTRGVRPYNHIDNFDLLRYLMRGSRLDQPLNCPLPLYHLMVDCWNLDPSLRPSFHELNGCVTLIRNLLLESRQVEAPPPVAAAIPTQDSVYYNAAIPPKCKECYCSEELYLSMQGSSFYKNILAEFG